MVWTDTVPNAAPPLPWYCDKGELPKPLPTIAEIEAATAEFPSIFDRGSRRTVLVNGCFVVKHGPVVFENEGHALLLVEHIPTVPAPRLYAMFREDEKLYIVMEFVPGQQLSDIWPTLSEDEKSPIVAQLRQAVDSLRALPSPEIFSGVFGGPLPHRYFFSAKKDPRITGPFGKEEDFCHALVLRSQEIWDWYGRRGWMNEFFSRHLPAALSGHRSVFTHSDFQRKNILVREKPGSSSDGCSGRSFEVAAILDWEAAGWYPSYWGYALCFAYFDWSDDWPEKVEHVLDPCVHEAAVMRMVAQALDA